MTPARSMRLPVQTGASALAYVAWVICMLGCAVVGAFIARSVVAEQHSAVLSLLAPGVVALTFGFASLMLALTAWVQRASDVVLDGDGVRIVGGPWDGRTIAWSAIDGPRCALRGPEDEFSPGRRVTYVNELAIGLLDGSDLVLARAVFDDEKSSLAALADTIAAAASTRSSDQPLESVEAPTVLVCEDCGGSLAPDDVPSLRCAHCGREVAVPEELRARLRDARARATEPRLRRLLERVVSEPGAGATNAALMVLGIALLSTVPLFILWVHGGFYVAWVGLLIAITVVARGRVRDRRALRLLALDLCATSPERAGAPLRCRSCGAPLPVAAPGAMMAHCLHCGTENVLGFDRVRVTHQHEDARQLSSALVERTVHVLVRWLMLLLALALMTYGVWIIYWWSVVPSHRR